MKLKNINGTSQPKCLCGSWLKHWERYSGRSVAFCPVTGCLNMDLVGAHVQKANSPDNGWYIYPLCSSHIQSKGELQVAGAYRLIPSNKQETCEKR